MHFANIRISAINNRERLLFIFSLGCKDSYGRSSIHEESMICAGEEGKDSCQVSFYHLRTYAYFPSKKYVRKKFYQRNLKKSALVVKARKKSLYPYNFVAPYNS